MKTNKFLYGLLAFAPIVGLLLMFLFMGLMFAEIFNSIGEHRVGPYENEWDMPYYPAMMMTAIGTGVLSMVSLILHILHCQNNILITQDKRLMWTLVLVFTGAIGGIIYYFTWIAREDRLMAERGWTN